MGREGRRGERNPAREDLEEALEATLEALATARLAMAPMAGEEALPALASLVLRP